MAEPKAIEALVSLMADVDAATETGLAAFDRVGARLDADAIARAGERFEQGGFGDDMAETFAEVRRASALEARGHVHSEIWRASLHALCQDELGEKLEADLFAAHLMIGAALACVDGMLSAPLQAFLANLRRLAIARLALGDCEGEIRAEIDKWLAPHSGRFASHFVSRSERRGKLRRDLWRASLAQILQPAEAVG